MHRAALVLAIAMLQFAVASAGGVEAVPAGSAELVAAAVSPAAAAVTVERWSVMSQPAEAAGALATDPHGRPLPELGGVGLRWWLRRGRADLGVGIGTVGYFVAPLETTIDAPPGAPQTLLHGAPIVIVGWRWAVGERSLLYADASGMRRYGDDLVQAKVGVEWKPRTSALGFERGALGIRFDSGYRMSLRAKRGGLGVYLRSQF
jgi:hypothetical protein